MAIVVKMSWDKPGTIRVAWFDADNGGKPQTRLFHDRGKAEAFAHGRAGKDGLILDDLDTGASVRPFCGTDAVIARIIGR